MKQEDKFDKISERVYNASFVFTVILIVAATIGTAIARYTVDPSLILVPDNVFKFVEHVLYIFAIPQSIKIIGDKLPLVVQAIVAVRGQGGYGQSVATDWTSGSYPLSNNGYPTSGVGANPNTYY